VLDDAARRSQKVPDQLGMPMSDGLTPERRALAGEFLIEAGTSRSTRRTTVYDDALGRAWKRRKISDAEYWALLQYAYHWASGGLGGALQSTDLNRVFAHDPARLSGLAKTESQQDHRDAYRAARLELGRRPALVADQVALYGISLVEVGVMLGYRSAAHGRIAAAEILSDAGYRLGRFWKQSR
jgi:hypothetical protein